MQMKREPIQKAIRLRKEHFLDLRLKEYTKAAKYLMVAPESSISDEQKQLLMEDCSARGRVPLPRD